MDFFCICSSLNGQSNKPENNQKEKQYDIAAFVWPSCHPDGRAKKFWLARAIPQRNTTSFMVNRDGTSLLRCFPDNWEGSHYDWLNNDELMVTANYQGQLYAHVLFTIGKQDYRCLGNGLPDYDGHGTFSPDGSWMISDTYPGRGLSEQKICLMDMETEAVLPPGRGAARSLHRSLAL